MRETSASLAPVALLAGALVGALMAAGQAGAGGERAIECGEVVASSLDPLDLVYEDGTWLESYAFRLTAETTVTALMTTGGYAPYVFVTDTDSDVVADGEPPLTTVLPAGDYLLWANNLDVLADGEYPYELSLSCIGDDAHTLECGGSIAGQLDPSDTEYTLGTWIDALFFSVDEPTRVRFDLDGFDDVFDPLIILFDDSLEELGSEVGEMTVDLAAGDYYVYANNFFPLPDAVYPYRLSAECGVTDDCAGDCDGNGAVSIAELIRGVRLALGESGTEPCPAMDRNGDAEIVISELIAAVNAALAGC